MINSTEIAKGIHRISFYNEEDLRGITVPEVSFNLFLIVDERPAIVNTMYRRTFKRLHDKISEILDPASLRYIIVPHHEGDSSGAVNEWLAAAPEAVPVCSELCAMLSLRDLANKAPRVVDDHQVIELGNRRLHFLITPHINQWDSLMVYEETTGTLFPNDLFAMLGIGVTTDRDVSHENLEGARQVGYQADDRMSLNRALDKIERLQLKAIAPMHGPVLTGHLESLIRCFREGSLTSATEKSALLSN